MSHKSAHPRYIKPAWMFTNPSKANRLCDAVMSSPKGDTGKLDEMVTAFDKKLETALADGSYYRSRKGSSK